MKKVLFSSLCLVLVFALLICYPFAVSAHDTETQENEELDEDYVNISTKNCTLSISGISANVYAELTSTDYMSLTIKAELQKLKSGSYSTVETWNASKTGVTLSLSESRLINVFSTYRLKVTFTAGSETVVSYAYP